MIVTAAPRNLTLFSSRRLRYLSTTYGGFPGETVRLFQEHRFPQLHSRERGNPFRRVLRRPWFLDSCLRRNDSVPIGILPCFAARSTLSLPFAKDLSSHCGRAP